MIFHDRCQSVCVVRSAFIILFSPCIALTFPALLSGVVGKQGGSACNVIIMLFLVHSVPDYITVDALIRWEES